MGNHSKKCDCYHCNEKNHYDKYDCCENKKDLRNMEAKLDDILIQLQQQNQWQFQYQNQYQKQFQYQDQDQNQKQTQADTDTSTFENIGSPTITVTNNVDVVAVAVAVAALLQGPLGTGISLDAVKELKNILQA
ncbi:hypothetical protein [Sporosarcina psychrophila]|uniref:hypothetical protein n=1 Tax=Sporosarcina TaxID=1569 RepID=UPI0030D4F62D